MRRIQLKVSGNTPARIEACFHGSVNNFKRPANAKRGRARERRTEIIRRRFALFSVAFLEACAGNEKMKQQKTKMDGGHSQPGAPPSVRRTAPDNPGGSVATDGPRPFHRIEERYDS